MKIFKIINLLLKSVNENSNDACCSHNIPNTQGKEVYKPEKID